jgi:hypothetical protein
MMSCLARKFLLLAVLGAWAIAGGVRTTHAADSTTLEKQVKSAFVFNFLQFVDWPAAAFDKPDDPITIGVVDPEALGDTLAAAVEDKTVHGRKIVIRAVTPAAIGKCQVLILGSVAGPDLEKVLKAVGQASILTIGDTERFTDVGGIIKFFVEDRKERFEINQAAAQRAQLQVSSKLLKLARVVNK